MNNKTRTYKQDVKALLGATISFGLTSILAGLTPIGSKKVFYNWVAVFIATGLVVIFIFSFVVVKIHEYKGSPQKGWLAKYIVAIVWLPAAGGVLSLNLVYASLLDWRWIVPLALMYPAAALLPFVNPKLSNSLHDEAYAPSSCLARTIVFSLLAIGPAAGVFGVFLSNFSERAGNGVIGYSIVGLIMHFLFVWAVAAMAHQVWEERPWKKNKKR